MNEQPVGLIAMDLDGTLLGADKQISSENAEALRECCRRGIHVVMASGRSFEAIRMFAKGINIDCGIISCNGARMEASINGPLLMEDCIPKEQAELIFEELLASGIFFECYTAGRIYMADGFEVGERFHSHEARVLELDGYRLEYINSTERMRTEALDRAYKFVIFSASPDALEQVSKRMERFDVDVTSSWGDNIELMKKGAGKGKALAEYALRHGIRREGIMSFGDQLNDMDLLKASGWPVAMDNATDELKQTARIIAPHHDQSGVGRTIRKYILDEGETR